MSVAGHLTVLYALLSTHRELSATIDPEPMAVQLIEVRPAAAAQPTPEPPSPATPPPPRNIARPVAPPQDVVALAAGKGLAAEGRDELSDAQLATATTAGSGASGGDCNMARWLQGALRKDRLVQAAVAEVHRGRAIMVWNGDWVRHPGQEGNGLAAVREAILWDVAFAPEACRAEPVRGLVLLSLGDGPGSPRLVVGSGEWRWSDLLRGRPPVVEVAASRR